MGDHDAFGVPCAPRCVNQRRQVSGHGAGIDWLGFTVSLDLLERMETRFGPKTGHDICWSCYARGQAFESAKGDSLLVSMSNKDSSFTILQKVGKLVGFGLGIDHHD